MTAQRSRSSTNSRWSVQIALLLGVSIVLLIIMSVFAMRSITILSERADWVAHTERVRFEVSRVLRLSTDIETADRGYALTGDEQFLEPYRAAVASIGTELSSLQQLVIDNPREVNTEEQVRMLSEQQRASAASDVEAVRAGHNEQARARIASGASKRLLDAIREAAAKMTAEEDRLLELRRGEGARARRTSMQAMWATGTLAIFLMCFVVWMTLRDRARVQRAEAELATTLLSIADAVISTDAQGAISFMNQVAEQLTGWAAAAARNRKLDEVFHILNEQTGAAVESPVTRVSANHLVLLRRGGGETPIEYSSAPIFAATGAVNGVVLVFRNTSLQRVAERKLWESEQRFRAAVDAVHGVLWTNTADGEMRGEQPGWASLTGQTLEQYQGFGWADAVHPEDAQPTIDAWLQAVQERRPFTFGHRVRKRDGQWGIFSVRAIPLFEEGKPIREWVGVHTDITEQRRVEIALQEVSARKDVFLATLSHELRNPLAPIRTAARLLESGKLGPQEMTRSFAIITRQVSHMASLLDDLLDVSRITRGTLILKKEQTLLTAILEGAVEAARPSLDAKRHHLHLEWPTQPIELEADPVRLVQVATNLLCNAAKYTDPEGHITFGAALEADKLILYVRDTGIGIPADRLTQVFDMFTQVHSDPARSEGGLGIGLALVKGLVELHGASIEVRSAGMGCGSEFVVTLPATLLRIVSRQVPPATLMAPATVIKRRVVIADDSLDGAETLGMLLEFSGHHVVIAHTGIDALALCAQHRPDICILDIGMPGLNGYEVAMRIRAQEWGAAMVLIAVTGYGQVDDKLRAQAAGFNHHLTKPIDPDVLSPLIDGR
jgi:PAS domain S-box-containing protein